MNLNYKLFSHQMKLMQSTAPICYMVCGRAAGKSYAASLLISKYFLEGKRVIALAQTFKSLHEVLFTEILARLEEMKVPYYFHRQSMKITYGKGVIYGASYENLEAIRGLTKISLAVCDEAALSPNNLFPVLAPCLRGEGIKGYIRLLSTPRRGSWLNLYCKEHPDNVELIHARTRDNTFITDEQIELMKKSIVNDDMLQQELEGVMLDLDSDASIIQLKDYPRADTGLTSKFYYLGIDLAGLGCDNNVLTVVSKFRIEEQIKIQVADSLHLCEVAENLIRKWNIKCTYIDVTGSTSCGLLDLLKAKHHDVVGINFANAPYDKDRYANARAEMYGETSIAIKEGLYIANEDIKTQLSYTTCFINQSGKLQLVKKSEIKELIGHSPDESDSLALSVYAMNHGSISQEADRAREISDRYLNFLEM